MANISKMIASITGMNESKLSTEGRIKNPKAAIKSTIPTVKLYFLLSMINNSLENINNCAGGGI